MAQYFFQRILPLPNFTPEAVLSLSNIFALILRNSPPRQKAEFVGGVLASLDRVISVELLTIIFNALSVYLRDQQDIERTVERAREVIGELPLAVKAG